MKLSDLSAGQIVGEIGTTSGDLVVIDANIWMYGKEMPRPTRYWTGRNKVARTGIPVVRPGPSLAAVQESVMAIEWSGNRLRDEDKMASFLVELLERHGCKMEVLALNRIITTKARDEAAVVAARERVAREARYAQNSRRVAAANEAVKSLTGGSIVGQNVDDAPARVNAVIPLDTLEALLGKADDLAMKVRGS